MLQTANSFFRNPFKLHWSSKPRTEWPRKERVRRFSVKPSISIHDIPVRILKQIISYVIVDTQISSLRQVCRGWNTAINNIIYDEIIKQSPELKLLMRCQTHSGVDNLEFPLQRSGLTNRCRIEFFPRINNTLEKQLFVDSYIFIEFFLLYKIGKKDFYKKKEISRFSMNSFKFDNPIVNSNSVIDLDLAFQYIPYEPLTFRVKDISFSPIYLSKLFKIKNKIDYKL